MTPRWPGRRRVRLPAAGGLVPRPARPGNPRHRLRSVAGEVSRFGSRGHRLAQQHESDDLALIGAERVSSFFQGQQHGLLVGRQARLGPGVGRPNSLADPADVEGSPGNVGSKSVGAWSRRCRSPRIDWLPARCALEKLPGEKDPRHPRQCGRCRRPGIVRRPGYRGADGEGLPETAGWGDPERVGTGSWGVRISKK